MTNKAQVKYHKQKYHTGTISVSVAGHTLAIARNLSSTFQCPFPGCGSALATSYVLGRHINSAHTGDDTSWAATYVPPAHPAHPIPPAHPVLPIPPAHPVPLPARIPSPAPSTHSRHQSKSHAIVSDSDTGDEHNSIASQHHQTTPTLGSDDEGERIEAEPSLSDQATTPLIFPPELIPSGLGIYEPLALIICTTCAHSVQRVHIHGHFKHHHTVTSLPDKAVYDQLFDGFQIPSVNTSTAPPTPITPITGITILQGYCCRIPSCPSQAFATPKSFQNTHFHKHHAGGRYTYTQLMEECSLQRVFGPVAPGWVVKQGHSGFPTNHAKLEGLYTELEAAQWTHVAPEIVHAPEDVRHIPPWLNRLGWFKETEGRQWPALVGLVTIPGRKERLTPLVSYMDKFVAMICDSSLRTLDQLILQWINSPDLGKYVIFKYPYRFPVD